MPSHRELMAELAQGLEDMRCERRVRAVVISGSGSAFCAGMDLNEMQETAKSANAQTLWQEDATAYRDLLEAMLRLPKRSSNHWRASHRRRCWVSVGL